MLNNNWCKHHNDYDYDNYTDVYVLSQGCQVSLSKYIYTYTLLVFLFVTDKRQNGGTDQA